MRMTWLRILVRIKQNQQLIVAGTSVVALVVFFQNCGASSNSGTSSGLVGGPEPTSWMSANVASHQFTNAISSPNFVVTFTASSPASNLVVTPAFPGGTFSIVGNTCTATSLGAGSACTVTVHYHNCSTSAQTGYLALGYANPATNTPGTAVVVGFTGVAGSPTACQQVVNGVSETPPSK